MRLWAQRPMSASWPNGATTDARSARLAGPVPDRRQAAGSCGLCRQFRIGNQHLGVPPDGAVQGGAVGWGRRARGGFGGDGAAHAQTVRWLVAGQTLAISVGLAADGANGGATIVAFPDGTLVTTTGGARGNAPSDPGIAIGGDVNVPGQARSGLNGGSAGSFGTYVGGAGGILIGRSPVRRKPWRRRI